MNPPSVCQDQDVNCKITFSESPPPHPADLGGEVANGVLGPDFRLFEDLLGASADELVAVAVQRDLETTRLEARLTNAVRQRTIVRISVRLQEFPYSFISVSLYTVFESNCALKNLGF